MKIKKRLEIFFISALLFASGTAAQATYQRTSEILNRYARQEGQTLTGIASWYSKESPGIKKTTANMETFDDMDLTCAMWDVPFNQKLRVTNLDNGRSVIVRVNDRGPHKRLVEKGRIIDLSKGAFQEIAGLKKGLVSVKVEFL